MVDFFNPAGRDLVGSFYRGRQLREQSDLRKQQQGILQQQAQQLEAQSQRQGEARGILGQAMQAQGQERQGLLKQAFTLDPEQTQQATNYLSSLDEAQRAEALRENESLTRIASNAKAIDDPVMQEKYLIREREKAARAGRSTDNLDEALSADYDTRQQMIINQIRNGIGIQELAKQQIIAPQEQAQQLAKEERQFGRLKELKQLGFEQQRELQAQTLGQAQRHFEAQQRIREAKLDLESSKTQQDIMESQLRLAQAAKELEEQTGGIRVNVAGKNLDASEVLMNAKPAALQAAGYADRMEAANKEILETKKTGFNPASPIDYSLGLSRVTGTNELQKFNRAKTDFITAVLRKESGAAIGKDEFEKEESKYFPKLGDTAQTIKAKEEARQRALKNMVRESQGAYQAEKAIEKAQANQSQNEFISSGGITFKRVK